MNPLGQKSIMDCEYYNSSWNVEYHQQIWKMASIWSQFLLQSRAQETKPLGLYQVLVLYSWISKFISLCQKLLRGNNVWLHIMFLQAGHRSQSEGIMPTLKLRHLHTVLVFVLTKCSQESISGAQLVKNSHSNSKMVARFFIRHKSRSPSLSCHIF